MQQRVPIVWPFRKNSRAILGKKWLILPLSGTKVGHPFGCDSLNSTRSIASCHEAVVSHRINTLDLGIENHFAYPTQMELRYFERVF